MKSYPPYVRHRPWSGRRSLSRRARRRYHQIQGEDWSSCFSIARPSIRACAHVNGRS